ncbi:hypothetical protein BHU72_09410 [Desulfuribacillus stibiiarsenatis]|uniref:Endonuclease MutS2 n=1 Tax=Desulfuribacillus stibiiarsenatis TaxID=1390249 RepID=A0A1E5L2Q2_9FIRM|nr:endonuclease MutS2 [Desulfuribacillus stibiiarsenatis]OEH84425.1 hypothetical protein BHU72_09410 [Desulfuribacillus stibiiarsenatis]
MRAKDLGILEYNKIKLLIAQKAQTHMGKERIEQLLPTNKIAIAKKLQQETEEAKAILNKKGHLSFGGIRDVRTSLKRAKMQGVLNAEELLNISNTIRGTRRVRNFIQDYWKNHAKNINIEGTSLYPYVEPLNEHPSLERDIESCIDENGTIKDSASPTLLQIRRQIQTLQGRIRQKLDEILRNSNYQKMLQDLIITTRNDRYVIPVKSEYRGVFGGMVHDQSSSGATLFIEPESVVSLNNQQKEMEIKEKNEIDRILRDLTEKVAIYADEIQINMVCLQELDCIFAKAMYAVEKRGVFPILNDKGFIKARKVRHPLIHDSEVVPVDVTLGEDFHTIVITGPNTGGKTVTLKTIGLLSLLACSGVQPTTEEECHFAVFDGIYADIGDEQSIEQNLSTFSGHMTNIIYILESVTPNSLVLVDELGAGTDPQEGAALAMALLTDLHNLKVTTIATTHYSELKSFAYNMPRMINASVEFDVESLRPTYRLLIGIPGKSNALAIARRLGLKERYIQLAEQYLSREEKDVNSLLENLESSRKELEDERQKIEKITRELELQKQKMQDDIRQFQEFKEKKIKQLEDQARLEIAQSKKAAEGIISELRDLQKEQQILKDHVLIEKKKEIEAIDTLSFQKHEKKTDVKHISLMEKLTAGDEVKVRSLNQKGTVLQKASDSEYLVQVGIMKVTLKREDLDKIKAKPIIETKQIVRLQKEHSDVRMELDLRGKTIDEAIYDIEHYLDKVILAGLREVSIIHGKGTGALRVGLQEYFRKHPRIQSMRIANYNEGGMGVTVLTLKQ